MGTVSELQVGDGARVSELQVGDGARVRVGFELNVSHQDFDGKRLLLGANGVGQSKLFLDCLYIT